MNKPFKEYLFRLGGILLVVGAVLFYFQQVYAPYIFAVGAAAYALYYLTTPYSGSHFRNKRLYRFHLIASVLLIASSTLLFKAQREWILLLLIAAFLEIYTTFAWRDENENE